MMRSEEPRYYIIGKPVPLTSKCGLFTSIPSKSTLKHAFDDLTEDHIMLFMYKQYVKDKMYICPKKYGQFQSSFGNYYQRPILTVEVIDHALLIKEMSDEGSVEIFATKSNLKLISAKLLIETWGSTPHKSPQLIKFDYTYHPSNKKSGCVMM